MSTKRKRHSAKFKAKIALEAYNGDKTTAELISTYKISSGQITPGRSIWLMEQRSYSSQGRLKRLMKLF